MSLDLSGITTGLQEMGPAMIGQKLSTWDLQQDVYVHRNVTVPRALTKISAASSPRPYRKQDDFTDVNISDRRLTVYQSKWDFDLDYEVLRNTYLSAASNGTLDPNNVRIHDYIIDHMAKEYLAALYDNTVGGGTYNASGSTPAAIATGYRTLITDLITATTITPVATGSTTTSNAVTKVEQLADACPTWMKQFGFKIYCSFAEFSKYKAHYRTLNGFGFDKENLEYRLDGFKGRLCPRGWMGSSARLIVVPDVPAGSYDNVLHFGTNDEQIAIYPTVHLNLIRVRMLFPIGLQISDLSAIVVNDQA